MPKIKILFLSSNPRDRDYLRLREEYDSIKRNIDSSPYNDLLELIQGWDVKPSDLIDFLLDHKPYIIHFVGHGESNDIILLNKKGNSRPVSGGTLARLFKNLAGDTKVIFLNACCTSAQARQIAQDIGCAIGVTQDISDTEAIMFASTFYKMIAFGQSVRNAFDVSLLNLQMNGRTEDANLPVLSLREGVNPDALIPVQQLYIGHWFLSHPTLWNNYLAVINFAKSVHHTFQTLDIQHISEITRRLDSLEATRRLDYLLKSDRTPNLSEVNSIQLLWDNYVYKYYEFKDNLPDRSPVDRSFHILQSVYNQKASRALSEAHQKHYKTIVSGLDKYIQTHSRAADFISKHTLFETLKDPQANTDFHSEFYNLVNLSRILVVNADNLLKKLIEATEVGK